MNGLSQKIKNAEVMILDFDGVMTDNRVLVLENGQEGVFCHRGDGLGIEMLNKTGFETFVISREINPVVSVRCRKLGIECWQGIDKKEDILKRETEKRGFSPDQVIYIGNDLNDLECLKIAGLKVAVADSEKTVLEIADYVTKKKGGLGAVREICDLILKHKYNREF